MRDAIDVYRHAYAERMADWKTNEEQLANAAAVIEADREQVRLEQLEEIEVLRAHVGHWTEEARRYAENADYWRTKCEALQADKAKLREALAPFVDFWEWDTVKTHMGHPVSQSFTPATFVRAVKTFHETGEHAALQETGQ
jgi:hypothetical protein